MYTHFSAQTFTAGKFYSSTHVSAASHTLHMDSGSLGINALHYYHLDNIPKTMKALYALDAVIGPTVLTQSNHISYNCPNKTNTQQETMNQMPKHRQSYEHSSYIYLQAKALIFVQSLECCAQNI